MTIQVLTFVVSFTEYTEVFQRAGLSGPDQTRFVVNSLYSDAEVHADIKNAIRCRLYEYINARIRSSKHASGIDADLISRALAESNMEVHGPVVSTSI